MVISNSILQRNDYDDVKSVEKLHEKYVKRCKELKHTYRLAYRNYCLLEGKYKKLLDYMNKNIKEYIWGENY